MYKPNSPIQRRNSMFRAAWYCAKDGQFLTARRIIKIADAPSKSRELITFDQLAAIRAVACQALKQRRGTARFPSLSSLMSQLSFRLWLNPIL